MTGEPPLLRAVLVDDTPDLRLLVRTALEGSGRFQVVGEAGDGAAGIRLTERAQPDVVLLDLAMPVMDGLEALPGIRRAAPRATVVVLSGFASEAMHRQASRAGAHGYLQKGADPFEIVGALLHLTGALPAGVPAPARLRERAPAADVVGAAPFGVVVFEPAPRPGEQGLAMREANPAARELLGDDAGDGWRALAAAVLEHRAALLEGARISVVVPGPGGPLSATLAATAAGPAAYLGQPDPGAGAGHDGGAWLRSAVAGAAHEIRNPTVVIAGAVAALTRTDPPAPAHLRAELLAALARQARLLDRATGDLLTAAQAHGGGVRVEPRPVELAPALAAAVADAPGKPATVTCPPGLWVHADPLRLQQMLHNLLANAAKYGSPPVTVRARVEGAAVRVGVHDAGRGVPEDFRGALFDEFSRAAGTGAPGSGLGLFVVRTLAAAHGGAAFFEPREGGGAVFGFTLPAAAAAPPVPAVAPAEVAAR